MGWIVYLLFLVVCNRQQLIVYQLICCWPLTASVIIDNASCSALHKAVYTFMTDTKTYKHARTYFQVSTAVQPNPDLILWLLYSNGFWDVVVCTLNPTLDIRLPQQTHDPVLSMNPNTFRQQLLFWVQRFSPDISKENQTSRVDLYMQRFVQISIKSVLWLRLVSVRSKLV